MNLSILFAFLIGMCLPFGCKAQFSVKAQLGISYIEHLSTGVTLKWGNHHSASVLYGSNFFINTQDFSNLFLQYDLSVPGWKIKKLTPRFGVKGGDSYYTNEYYRWKVVSVIPFVGASLPVSDKLDLLVEVGAAFSFEQTVERINQGEIGHYRELLPEAKAAMVYTLFTKRKR